MANESYYLTRKEIREMIRNSVKDILKEIDSNEDLDLFDLTQYDINDLKQAYRDYRLTPYITVFGDILSDDPCLTENIGDILPPDTVVHKISQKYMLPLSFVTKREAHNQLFIYIIIGKIGVNDKLIAEDMQKMGYFLSITREPKVFNGMVFQMLQFEPYSQKQNDETDNIKRQFDFLYHWTPTYNVNEILLYGLIPNHKNPKFYYPSRIYLMKGNSSDDEMDFLGKKLYQANYTLTHNKKYTLLRIDIEDIDDRIRFYYDTNSPIGVYTEQPIPANRIVVDRNVVFLT